jgi:hypothetical protein
MQLERRVASWLALQAGCGLGVHPQLAATARLRIPEAPAFNLGIGVSGGRYKQVDCYLCFEGSPFTMRWDPAVWNNYEVSVEHRARGPFTLRASLGLAALLNRDSVEVACDSCSPDRRPPAATRVLGFGGIAIGATF